MKRVIFALVAMGVAAGSQRLEAQEFQVVVNAANPISEISKSDASKIFQKKSKKFGNGQGASPVDLPANSPVREQFSQGVHGRSASAISSYWQQQIFSGRGVPPEEKGSDSAVLDFVRSNPDGIGYVAGDAPLGDGVKTVPITG